MKDAEKAKQIIESIYPSTSMGDYGLKEMLVTEAMKYKDEQTAHTVREMFGAMLMRKDSMMTDIWSRQYIDVDTVENILEDFFRIKIEQ